MIVLSIVDIFVKRSHANNVLYRAWESGEEESELELIPLHEMVTLEDEYDLVGGICL